MNDCWVFRGNRPGTPLASIAALGITSAMQPIISGDDTPVDYDDVPTTDAIQVLLVTGDADLRAAGHRALSHAGYRVQVAAHSGHAVLVSLTWRVDVLIAELSAPDISGPGLAQLLKKHHPGLRAVFMANPGTPEGLDNVVVRPFTRDDLIERLAVTSPSAAS